MPRPWGVDVTSQHLIVTELHTSTGGVGTGFSWTVRAGGQAVKAMIDADCAPAVAGLPATPESVWDHLHTFLRESGGGVTTLAMAGHRHRPVGPARPHRRAGPARPDRPAARTRWRPTPAASTGT